MTICYVRWSRVDGRVRSGSLVQPAVQNDSHGPVRYVLSHAWMSSEQALCGWCRQPVPAEPTAEWLGGHSRTCKKRFLEVAATQYANSIESRFCGFGQASANAMFGSAPTLPGSDDGLLVPRQPPCSDAALGADPLTCDPSPSDCGPYGDDGDATSTSSYSAALPLSECSDPPDDSSDEDASVGPTTEHIDITSRLCPDALVCSMLHGLSNRKKNRCFTVLRALAAIARRRGEHISNPVMLSSIRNIHQYEAHMDQQAVNFRCQFKEHHIGIVSDSSDLQDLPPVPLYMRALDDVVTCALAAAAAAEAPVVLEPFPPSNDAPGRPLEHGRVEHPMQGSFARAAGKVGPSCVSIQDTQYQTTTTCCCPVLAVLITSPFYACVDPERPGVLSIPLDPLVIVGKTEAP